MRSNSSIRYLGIQKWQLFASVFKTLSDWVSKWSAKNGIRVRICVYRVFLSQESVSYCIIIVFAYFSKPNTSQQKFQLFTTNCTRKAHKRNSLRYTLQSCEMILIRKHKKSRSKYDRDINCEQYTRAKHLLARALLSRVLQSSLARLFRTSSNCSPKFSPRKDNATYNFSSRLFF